MNIEESKITNEGENNPKTKGEVEKDLLIP